MPWRVIDISMSKSYIEDFLYGGEDSAKREFAEDLLSYTDTFYETIASSLKDVNVTEAGNMKLPSWCSSG